MSSIKKGDNVLVIAGREKGKKGIVEKIVPETGRIVVTGINVRKHHLKPNSTRPKGGIAEYPAAFSRANAMPICPHCSKPTRVRHAVAENAKKYRTCAACGGSLDAK